MQVIAEAAAAGIAEWTFVRWGKRLVRPALWRICLLKAIHDFLHSFAATLRRRRTAYHMAMQTSSGVNMPRKCL